MVGAGFVLAASLVSAAPAAANAERCNRLTFPGVCYFVYTPTVGNSVQRVDVYDSGGRVFPKAKVTVQAAMLKDGKAVYWFWTRVLDFPGSFEYCKSNGAGTLDPYYMAFWPDPCHTWPVSGYQLGIRYRIDGGGWTNMLSGSSTVDIKKK